MDGEPRTATSTFTQLLSFEYRPDRFHSLEIIISVAGTATSIIFLATNTCLSRQNASFIATIVCLSRQHFVSYFVATVLLRQKFCGDKSFVATRILLTSILLSPQKTFFCREKQVFVETKMIYF